jgi:hypothetical protein
MSKSFDTTHEPFHSFWNTAKRMKREQSHVHKNGLRQIKSVLYACVHVEM